MYTPNRVGEYGGRVLILEHKRWEALFATMMGSVSQIAANTFWSGCLCLLFIYNILPPTEFKTYYVAIVAVLIVITLLMFALIHCLGELKINWRFFKKVKEGTNVFRRFDYYDKWSLFLISSVRFFVYVIQYYCLLKFFNVQIPLSLGVIAIGCMFFVQTIIPTIALAELGIRGIISLKVMGYLSDNVAGILDATFTLWMLNLVLPSLLGLVVLLRTNINLKELPENHS